MSNAITQSVRVDELTFSAPEGTLVETGRGLTHGGLTLHYSTPVAIGNHATHSYVARRKTSAPRTRKP